MDNFSLVKITDDKAYLIYLKNAVLKYKNIHFPKIYEVVDIYEGNVYMSTLIVMEKLYKFQKRKNESTKKIMNVVNRDDTKDDSFIEDKNYPNSFNKFIKIMRLLKRNNKRLTDDFTFSSGLNVMFRKNNDLVVIDPFYYVDV